MRVRDVDSFWKEFAEPVLDKAGFRRLGRQYVAKGPRNRRAVIDFISEANGGVGAFEVTFGVTTPEHVRFLEDQGFPPGDWPLPSDALIRAKLFSPEFARRGAPWRVPSSEWSLGDGDRNHEVGAALARALVDDMLPRIHSWYETRGMWLDLVHLPTGVFPGLVPLERAIAMALLEVDDDGDHLERTLDRLPPGDFVREWIERRFGEPSRI